MVLLIKANTQKDYFMDKKKFLIKMVAGMMETGFVGKWMEMDTNILLTANLIRDILRIALNMAVEHGSQHHKTMISMLVNIFIIKSMDLEFLLMPMATSMKVYGNKVSSNTFLLYRDGKGKLTKKNG